MTARKDVTKCPCNICGDWMKEVIDYSAVPIIRRGYYCVPCKNWEVATPDEQTVITAKGKTV